MAKKIKSWALQPKGFRREVVFKSISERFPELRRKAVMLLEYALTHKNELVENGYHYESLIDSLREDILAIDFVDDIVRWEFNYDKHHYYPYFPKIPNTPSKGKQ